MRSISIDTFHDGVETLLVLPPDGGWGWLVVIAAFFCNCVADGAIYSFGIFLEDISKTFDVHPTTVAIANSLMLGFNYSLAPLTCSLVNRFGFRMAGFLGGFLAALGFYLSSVAHTIELFLILIGPLAGWGVGMIYVSSMIAVGFYFEKWRSLATSIAVTGSSVGIFLYPMFVEHVIQNYTWKIKFLFVAIICVITGLLALIYRPLKPVSVPDVERRGNSLVQIFMLDAVSMASGRGVAHRFNNLNFPTAADINRQAPQDLNIVPHQSRASVQRSTHKRSCLCKCLIGCWSYIKYKLQNETRPMYRDDILYHGDRKHLKQNQSYDNIYETQSGATYVMSVTRVLTQKDLREHRELCLCCTESIVRPLTTMFDLTLMQLPSFVMLCISGFFSMLGMNVPFVYTIERAVEMGIERESALSMISAMGLFNGVGRVLGGIVASQSCTTPLQVSMVTCLACGVLTIGSPLFKGLYAQYVYASLYGLTLACQTSLKTPVIVDIWGLDRLTNAFGLILLFQGVAGFLGVSVAGKLMTWTDSYNMCFYFSGVCLSISALLMIPVTKLRDWELRAGRYY